MKLRVETPSIDTTLIVGAFPSTRVLDEAAIEPSGFIFCCISARTPKAFNEAAEDIRRFRIANGDDRAAAAVAAFGAAR